MPALETFQPKACHQAHFAYTVEGTILRDKIKDEFAVKSGYELIRIPYWDLRNLGDILGAALKLEGNIE